MERFDSEGGGRVRGLKTVVKEKLGTNSNVHFPLLMGLINLNFPLLCKGKVWPRPKKVFKVSGWWATPNIPTFP